MYIDSFNINDITVQDVLFCSHLQNEKTEAKRCLKEKPTLPKVTQLVSSSHEIQVLQLVE